MEYTLEQALAKWCVHAGNFCMGETCMMFLQTGSRYECQDGGELACVPLYRCGLVKV